jgi:pyruvate-formate lyase-activating enzyme
LIFLPLGYCNNYCIFCHHEGLSDARDHLEGREFSPGRLRDVVEWLRPAGLQGVIFSGGEPLLAINNVLEVAAALPNVPVTLLTNGTLLWRLIRRLVDLRERSIRVRINLPSFDARVLAKLTGRGDISLERMLVGVRALLHLGFDVDLNCVVCSGENDTAEAVADYIRRAEDLGVTRVRFLIQAGAAATTLQALTPWLTSSHGGRAQRDGRVVVYERAGAIPVDTVTCQERNPVGESSWAGGSDIYLSARHSVKLGLWGEERCFEDWDDVYSLLADYLGLANPRRPAQV